MKKILLFCLMAIFSLSLMAENLTFMTYNLERNKGLNFQSSRIAKHAQVITAANADVVAVQEVEGNANFNNLKSAAGMDGQWFDIAGNGYGIGILWKASLGTPTITNVKISPTSGSSDSENRAFMIAEFVDFCFYSTHFSLNADDRDKMVAEMISRANAVGKTVFVGGDFNAQPNYRAMLTLKGAGFNILNDEKQFTYSSNNPESVIDMILGFRKNATNKSYTIVERGIPTSPSGVTLSSLSDHLPYVVTVDLQEPTAASLVVTTTEMDQTVEGSLLYCLAQAADDDVIEFNVDAAELTLPATVTMKSITIDGWNQYNGQRIILKKPAGSKFFDLTGTTNSTLKNIVMDGEDIAGAIGITSVLGTTLNLENCVLKNINSGATANNGGAMRVQGVLNVKSCLFENNTTIKTEDLGGGAICIYNAAAVTIENSSFIGNNAARGGAIMANGNVANGYTLNVYNCTFANNEALGASNARGGAIYIASPTSTEVNTTFINCTIVGNKAGNNGGGVCFFPSANKMVNISFINSIIAYNKTTSNSDIDAFTYYPARINFVKLTNCIYGTIIASAAGATWTNSQNADIVTADIFKSLSEGDFVRPLLSEINGMKVAELSEESIALGAGTATVTGFTIPAYDQLLQTRPAVPAIGALEYNDFGADPEPEPEVIPQIYTVTSTGTDAETEGSFAWCLAQAVAGDVIEFDVDADAVVVENTTVISLKSIIINGYNAHNDKKIKLVRNTPANRMFDIASGVSVMIKNVIVEENDTPGNTVINAVNGSLLLLENCEFRGINSQTNNGAGARIQGEATIRNCIFENNEASGSYGGAAVCIYHAADVTIENCSFIGNKAIAGGAIVANSTNANALSLKISNCTFANNEATLGESNCRGGAIYLTNNTSGSTVNAVFINNTIVGNYAANDGGGITAFSGANTRIINISLVNNIMAYNSDGTNGYRDVHNWNNGTRVNITAKNCLFGNTNYSTYIDESSIKPASVEAANIFAKTLETFVTDKKRPVLSTINGMKVAELSENSIARNAGVATLTGFTIPTEDQLENLRPATPAVGAVEYISPGPGTGIAATESDVRIAVKDREIFVSGLSETVLVRVYNLTGNLVKEQMLGNDGIISMQHIAGNIFIAQIGNENFKLILK